MLHGIRNAVVVAVQVAGIGNTIAIGILRAGFQRVRNAIAVAVDRRGDVTADFEAVVHAVTVAIGI